MSAQVVHLPVLREGEQRPRTRGDCIDGPRPCPWVSCTEHTVHGLMLREGGDQLTDDDLVEALATLPATCVLDVADEGADGDGTLKAIGEILGLTRERVRQIEAKALERLDRRVGHLHDAITEEPERVLRPHGCGPVRPIEDVRRHQPPAQHAHLPGPGDVTEAAQPFWCPWIGTPMTGGLCVKRHQARTRPSAMGGGAAGHAWPTYPQCSRCPDGAAMAARLGVVELVPMRAVLPTEAAAQEHTATERDVVAVPVRAIDWMGEGPEEASSPANDTEHTEHTEREEQKVMATTKVKRSDPERVQRMNAGRITQPTAGARCAFPGCEHAPIPWMAELAPELRAFCKTHRTRAQVLRTTLQVPAAEAAARLIAGAGKGTTRARPAAAAPPPEPTSGTPRCGIKGCTQERAGVRADTRRELEPFCTEHRQAVRNARDRAGGDWGLAVRRVTALMAAGVDTTNPHAVRALYEREGLLLGGSRAPAAAPELAPSEQSLRDESDRYFAEARELRAELERVRAQLAAAEQRAAVSPPPAAPVQPLPLSRLAALEKALWTHRGQWHVVPNDDGTWSAERVSNVAERPYAVARRNDPDAALAALVTVVELFAQNRIAELTAALEGGRG